MNIDENDQPKQFRRFKKTMENTTKFKSPNIQFFPKTAQTN